MKWIVEIAHANRLKTQKKWVMKVASATREHGAEGRNKESILDTERNKKILQEGKEIMMTKEHRIVKDASSKEEDAREN